MKWLLLHNRKILYRQFGGRKWMWIPFLILCHDDGQFCGFFWGHDLDDGQF